MERAAVPASTPAPAAFRDGLGERRRVTDPKGTETLELLCLRTELAAVPSFEFALRERVSRLANFRQSCYGRVRGVERLNDREATLAIVSECTTGFRLYDLLVRAEQQRLNFDIQSALIILRQLVPAVALLHESGRETTTIAHGALAPERLIVTPNARLVIVEYVMGAALEQLRFSHDRYWKELRLPLPRAAGSPRFDQRADIFQIGMIGLSLILGRPVRDTEYPGKIADMVASTWALSARGGFEPLPPGLRAWLGRALQLEGGNPFTSVRETRTELDKVAGEGEPTSSPSNLEAFLARYQAAECPASVEGPARPAATAQPRPASGPTDPALRPGPTPPTGGASSLRVAPVDGLPKAQPPATGAVPSKLAPAATGAPSPFSSAFGFETESTQRFGSTVPTPPRSAPILRPSVTASSSERLEVTAFADSVLPKQAQPAPPTDPAIAPKSSPEKALPEGPRHDTALFGSPQAADDDFADLDLQLETPKRKPRRLAVAILLLTLLGGGFFAARQYMSGIVPVAGTTGTLVIATNPSGAQVIVDGEPRGTSPLTLTLNVGSHMLELVGGGEPRSLPVTISAGKEVSHYIELPKGAPAAGQLQIRSEPEGARVTVDGVPRGPSPITVTDLPPGEHIVVLDSPLGSTKRTVMIESGATASLVVPLGSAPEAAPASGWIAVVSPIDVQVFERDQFLGSNRSDRIMLSAGRHDVDIVNEPLGYRATRTVQVAGGMVATINVEMPKGAISLNALPWAEVWIDGEKVGETPIGNLEISLGIHDVVFRHPDLGEQHHTATVTLKGITRLSVDLRKR